MSTNPLVSILIPAYNSEKWIEATIKSALGQTWKNKEIIIVDDGSKDKTYAIAKKYETETLKVIAQENSGASAARNKALSLSQGDFIQWLDSDDILAPDKIELQLKKSDYNPETKILYSSAWGSFYYNLNRAKFRPNSLWFDLSPKQWLLNHMGKGDYMYPAVWLVSRKLTNLAGSWNVKLSYNDDGEYFCRVVATSEMIKFIPKALSYHRIGNLSSLSASKDSKKSIKSLYQSVNLCIEHLQKLENSEIVKKACVNTLTKVENVIYDQESMIINDIHRKIVELGGTPTPITRSKKYKVIKKVLGAANTLLLKKLVWNIEILIKRNWDKLLRIFS